MTINAIALITAMRAEAHPAVERLGLAPVERPAGAVVGAFWRGKVGGVDVSLAQCGVDPATGVDCIGTVPAALTAAAALRTFEPDLVVNVGVAGGFSARGAAIGDVYLSSDRFYFHDRRIELPGFKEYGLGAIPCARAPGLAQALGAKQGVVSTGDSLDDATADAEMFDRTQPHVKEMEAAAIAWVCGLAGTPFLALKAVSDLVDAGHSTEEEFLRNLEAASAKLGEMTVALIGWCAGVTARKTGDGGFLLEPALD